MQERGGEFFEGVSRVAEDALRRGADYPRNECFGQKFLASWGIVCRKLRTRKISVMTQTQPASSVSPANGPWWRELNSYHWFVLVVAALGWMFDCLDQQLFTLAKGPAMNALLKHGENPTAYATYATSIFLVGWASGGLLFGVLGDRIGRAKTMVITILM